MEASSILLIDAIHSRKSLGVLQILGYTSDTLLSEVDVTHADIINIKGCGDSTANRIITIIENAKKQYNLL